MKLNIANRLRTLRGDMGMTQEQLAERLGVSAKSVSRWECGATYPDLEMVPVLAEIFGVSMESLLDAESSAKKDAPFEVYHKLDRIENLEERLTAYRQARIEYPQDTYFIYRLCVQTEDLAERRKLAHLLYDNYKDRKYGDWAYVKSALGHLINLEDEDKIKALLDKVTSPLDMSRELQLEGRYNSRNEVEKYEMQRARNALWALRTFLDRLVSEQVPVEEQVEGHIMRMAVLNQLTGGLGKHPVLGDGEVDMWFRWRLDSGFALAQGLTVRGQYAEAIRLVEDVVRFYEKIWTYPIPHPQPAKLSFRVSAFEPLCGYFREKVEGYANEPIYLTRRVYEETSSGYVSNYAVGWRGWDDHFLLEKEFDPIREDARFQECLERVHRYRVIVPKENTEE